MLLLPTPSPSPAPGVLDAATHAPVSLSFTGTVALLLCALALDYASFGPEWLRDRVAFLMALAAWRVGWDGSIVDRYTVDTLSAWVEQAKATGNTGLEGAKTGEIIGVGVCLLAMYCAGCLLPTKAHTKLGRYALLTFTPATKPGGGPAGGKYRLNWRLQCCAAALGLLADLAGGLIGTATQQFITLDVEIMAPVPGLLFGVS